MAKNYLQIIIISYVINYFALSQSQTIYKSYLILLLSNVMYKLLYNQKLCKNYFHSKNHVYARKLFTNYNKKLYENCFKFYL